MDSQQYDIWVWKGVSWNSHVHVKCKDSPSSSVFFPSCFREPEMSDPSLGVKMGSIPSTSEQRGCEQIIYPSEKGCLHPIPIVELFADKPLAVVFHGEVVPAHFLFVHSHFAWYQLYRILAYIHMRMPGFAPEMTMFLWRIFDCQQPIFIVRFSHCGAWCLFDFDDPSISFGASAWRLMKSSRKWYKNNKLVGISQDTMG